jgi:hypothetical protein
MERQEYPVMWQLFTESKSHQQQYTFTGLKLKPTIAFFESIPITTTIFFEFSFAMKMDSLFDSILVLPMNISFEANSRTSLTMEFILRDENMDSLGFLTPHSALSLVGSWRRSFIMAVFFGTE